MTSSPRRTSSAAGRVRAPASGFLRRHRSHNRLVPHYAWASPIFLLRTDAVWRRYGTVRWWNGVMGYSRIRCDSVKCARSQPAIDKMRISHRQLVRSRVRGCAAISIPEQLSGRESQRHLVLKFSRWSCAGTGNIGPSLELGPAVRFRVLPMVSRSPQARH
jgi:hypothetical protein